MATTHADVNAILADDKDIVAKQDGGILVVGTFGEKVLQAKDATELPAGVGGTPGANATESTAGVVKKAATVAAPEAMTATADTASTAIDVRGAVTDLNDLISKYNALRTDVTALRTTLNNLLTNIKAAGQVS